MRNLILAAAMTLGLGLVPGSLAATPLAPVPAAGPAAALIELAQIRGNEGPGGRYYGPRNRYRGQGYGYRRHYGPPPRAYGRSYYRRDRQWDRTW
ncbi:MAG: hypothetical protein Q8S58_05960 [Bosea sp. (in: a-proteobacteria)]|uniref:hypothetical protein n=1 Tax=Bosea sp. (in: a-proteobacteria) TaxID=1871050 RepID=UPI002735A728|nr:hypothetical protein [Bosea sp. (in: a-proteobacteria)]MDP3256579.1 hypothetical protein [Bosea sp. (in: a-proteobacteria)]MDP3318657.1 hypothetical protein [Bosea sp. (in: a-proteobacteria)]